MSTKTSFYYFRNTAPRLAPLVFLSILSGCSSLTFYTQAVIGQTSLLWHRQDIDQVIADSVTDETTRNKLQLVKQVLDYAENELNLPVDNSYSTYVATGRSYVVWNVFAAPEFSLELKSFCYPVAGCVSYQGYFQRSGADVMAARQRKDGHDVYVGGVAAYSTLGWFSDPVLDTFLVRSDVNLAALLFHELAHKAVYIPGDTQFNESFATSLEENSLKRWLTNSGQTQSYDNYVDARTRRAQVLEVIRQTRESLDWLYSSDAAVAEMREAKRNLIDELRFAYQKLQISWDGKKDFQRWMSTEINNAKLGAITEYNAWVPAFNQLLSERDGDISQFVDAVEVISKLSKSDRDEFLSLRLQE